MSNRDRFMEIAARVLGITTNETIYGMPDFYEALEKEQIVGKPACVLCGWTSHEPEGIPEYRRSWQVHYNIFCKGLKYGDKE